MLLKILARQAIDSPFLGQFASLRFIWRFEFSKNSFFYRRNNFLTWSRVWNIFHHEKWNLPFIPGSAAIRTLCVQYWWIPQLKRDKYTPEFYKGSKMKKLEPFTENSHPRNDTKNARRECGICGPSIVSQPPGTNMDITTLADEWFPQRSTENNLKCTKKVHPIFCCFGHFALESSFFCRQTNAKTVSKL